MEHTRLHDMTIKKLLWCQATNSDHMASGMSRQIRVVIHQRNDSIRVILKESRSTLLTASACVYLPVLFN